MGNQLVFLSESHREYVYKVYKDLRYCKTPDELIKKLQDLSKYDLWLITAIFSRMGGQL